MRNCSRRQRVEELNKFLDINEELPFIKPRQEEKRDGRCDRVWKMNALVCILLNKYDIL